MKKLYQKDEVWFAVLWIGLYVVGFSLGDGLSEKLGMPKLLTCAVGLVLSAVLFRFVKQNGLMGYYGLCRPKGERKRTLLYIPLIAMSSVNLWNGVALQASPFEIATHILSMATVAFLEELIFRGLLFNGMRRGGLTAAIIVSSLTFGMGHIVNLLTGAPVFDTLLQLVYASAIGFCYTAIFIKGGSLLPCILSHALVNSMSLFAVQPSAQAQLFIALATTVISLGYGAWLIKGQSKNIC